MFYTFLLYYKANFVKEVIIIFIDTFTYTISFILIFMMVNNELSVFKQLLLIFKI